MWARHGEDALGDVLGERSLCIHLPAAGRRRWCESRRCLQCRRARGGCCAAGGTLALGLCQKFPPQPASGPSHPSVGIWWPCRPAEGEQLRKNCGGVQLQSRGVPQALVLGAAGTEGGSGDGVVCWVWGQLGAAWDWGKFPSRWPRPGCCAKPGTLA